MGSRDNLTFFSPIQRKYMSVPVQCVSWQFYMRVQLFGVCFVFVTLEVIVHAPLIQQLHFIHLFAHLHFFLSSLSPFEWNYLIICKCNQMIYRSYLRLATTILPNNYMQNTFKFALNSIEFIVNAVVFFRPIS